ncbi:hypothetical protein KI387_010591, partial [Taxus chinensis]
EEEKIRKGPWTVQEDMRLVNYITLNGEGRWNFLAKAAGLRRSGKSCRLRWVNYLRPDLKRGNITPQEERLIIDLQSRWGNRWSRIAQYLPGRTDNEIKNHWRTRIKRKFNAGNRPSQHSMCSTCMPDQFIEQNDGAEKDRTPQSNIPQNHTVFHFDEQRNSNGVNEFNGNKSGLFETLAMPFQMESYADMLSELHEFLMEDGNLSPFTEF